MKFFINLFTLLSLLCIHVQSRPRSDDMGDSIYNKSYLQPYIPKPKQYMEYQPSDCDIAFEAWKDMRGNPKEFPKKCCSSILFVCDVKERILGIFWRSMGLSGNLSIALGNLTQLRGL